MQNLTWRDVWSKGIAPLLSLTALEALAMALRTDDLALLAEEATTKPASPTGPGKLDDVPCEAACAVAYGLWKSLGLHGSGEVEDAFNKLMGRAAAVVGGNRKQGYVFLIPFLSMWDDPNTSRKKKFALLLKEIEAELPRRKAA